MAGEGGSVAPQPLAFPAADAENIASWCRPSASWAAGVREREPEPGIGAVPGIPIFHGAPAMPYHVIAGASDVRSGRVGRAGGFVPPAPFTCSASLLGHAHPDRLVVPEFAVLTAVHIPIRGLPELGFREPAEVQPVASHRETIERQGDLLLA